MQPNHYYLGALLVIVAGCGFSLQPILAVAIYGDGANVAGLLWLRFLIPSLFLIPLFYYKKPPCKGKRGPLLLGILNGISALCYYSALQYITVSLTVMLLYLFPVIVFVIAYFRREQSLSFFKVVALLSASTGIYCSINLHIAGSGVGILLALAAALFYAFYVTTAPKLLPDDNALASTTWLLGGGALTFTVPILLGQGQLPQSMDGWNAAIALCILSTLLPMLLMIKGIELIRRNVDVAILSTLEPVAAIFWAWLLLQEQLSNSGIVGAALVLFAALLIITDSRRAKA